MSKPQVTPEMVVEIMQARFPLQFEICVQEAQIAIMAQQLEQQEETDV